MDFESAFADFASRWKMPPGGCWGLWTTRGSGLRVVALERELHTQARLTVRCRVSAPESVAQEQ